MAMSTPLRINGSPPLPIRRVSAAERPDSLLVVTRRPVTTRLQAARSEEHTSELQSLMRNSYAVFCLKKKKTQPIKTNEQNRTHSHPNKNKSSSTNCIHETYTKHK